MKFIIGLGNPGLRYRKTRHNVGFLALDFFAEQVFGKKTKWQKNTKAKALIIEETLGDERIVLIKPQTFMNNSGQSIAFLKKKYPQISAENIILIYDDIDLPIGKIRIKSESSAGGHNGVKSVIQHLGTQEFSKIKIGVGGEFQDKIPMDKFVLQRFNRAERKTLEESFSIIPEIISAIFSQGIESVMNKYN